MTVCLCLYYQIEYSHAMMSSTTEKAAYIWTEINKTDDEVAKELTDQDADTRIYATSVTNRFACNSFCIYTQVYTNDE